MSAAFNLEIEKDRTFVLPALLETTDLPLFMRDKLYADFGENYDTALRQLLKSINTPNKGQGQQIEIGKVSHKLKFLKLDGSKAKFERVHEIKCTDGEVSYYDEVFETDGYVSDFKSDTGTIDSEWSEMGRTHVRMLLGAQLRPGDSMKRKFSCIFNDSYMTKNEGFQAKVYSPVESVHFRISFLKGRPPLSWKFYERIGADIVRDDLKVQKRIVDGKVDLIAKVDNPTFLNNYMIRWDW